MQDGNKYYFKGEGEDFFEGGSLEHYMKQDGDTIFMYTKKENDQWDKSTIDSIEYSAYYLFYSDSLLEILNAENFVKKNGKYQLTSEAIDKFELNKDAQFTLEITKNKVKMTFFSDAEGFVVNTSMVYTNLNNTIVELPEVN